MSPSILTMGFFMSEINFCNTKEQLNHLGEVVTGKTNGSPSGADIDTSTLPYTGQVRKTLPALEQEYLDAIQGTGGIPIGAWTSGITTFNAYNEYAVYNGIPYKPRTTATLPYVAQGSDPTASPDDTNVQPYQEITEAQVVALVESTIPVELPKYTDINYSSVADLSSGIPMYADPGSSIIISERMNATFKVVSGGTANGYDILDAGNGNTAELQVSGTYGFLEYFGGVGGGIEETGPILAMVEWCNNNGKIPFTGLDSQCLSPIITANGISGIKGQSKITFPEGFVNPETTDDRKLFCVWNLNYSKVYDENTADTFKIHGIEWRVDMLDSDADINAIIGTANTNGVEIFDCKVSSADLVAAKPGARTCLSFYDANKHMRIHHNDLYNENTRAGGGCLWVQGGSGATLDDPQATEDIQIYSNNFYSTRPADGDEIIALYASGGVLKNVRVYWNNFYMNGGGQGVTAFSTPSPSTVGGLIDDVEFYLNKFYVEEFEFNVARIGGQYLSDGITRISFNNNKLFLKTTSSEATYGVRVIQTGSDIPVNGNEIYNEGSQNITRGISGFDETKKVFANNSRIIGGFDMALSRCFEANNNTIEGASWALDECVNCNYNTLIDIKTYLARFTGDQKYTFMGNIGNMNAGALIAVYQTNATGSTGDLSIKLNDITTNDANTRAVLCQGVGSAKQRSQLNAFSGSGLQPAFSNLVLSTDNDYYGTIS